MENHFTAQEKTDFWWDKSALWKSCGQEPAVPGGQKCLFYFSVCPYACF